MTAETPRDPGFDAAETDDGIMRATRRLQESLDALGIELAWRDCLTAARAARADVAETVREAKSAELEAVAERGRAFLGERTSLAWVYIDQLAAAIREGGK